MNDESSFKHSELRETFADWVARRFPRADIAAVLEGGHPANRGLQTLYTREVAFDDDSVEPTPVNLAVVASIPPPHRDWIVDGWAHAGASILLSSHGGLGKSLLAAQLAVCIAAGAPFFALPVRRARVLMLSTEDGRDELHIRLRNVADYLDADLVALERDHWLTLFDATGRDVPMFGREDAKASEPGPTSWFGWLRDTVEGRDVSVVIADSLSDLFDGDEIRRREVRRFVRLMTGLIVRRRGCVVLIGHIDKASARQRQGAGAEFYSGSTAWHNSVRQRWALYRDTPSDGEETPTLDDGRRILELQKNNYGRSGERIELRFEPDQGVLVGAANSVRVDGMAEAMRERTERRDILRAIIASTAAGVPVPAAMQGPRTAFLVLSSRPEFPATLKGADSARSGGLPLISKHCARYGTSPKEVFGAATDMRPPPSRPRQRDAPNAPHSEIGIRRSGQGIDARRPASNASYSTGGYRGSARAQPLAHLRPNRPKHDPSRANRFPLPSCAAAYRERKSRAPCGALFSVPTLRGADAHPAHLPRTLRSDHPRRPDAGKQPKGLDQWPTRCSSFLCPRPRRTRSPISSTSSVPARAAHACGSLPPLLVMQSPRQSTEIAWKQRAIRSSQWAARHRRRSGREAAHAHDAPRRSERRRRKKFGVLRTDGISRVARAPDTSLSAAIFRWLTLAVNRSNGAGMRRKMTMADIGRGLGISRQRVFALRAKGMPVDSIEKAREWRAANLDADTMKPDPRAPVSGGAEPQNADLKRRLLAAQTAIAEVKARAEGSDMLPARLVERGLMWGLQNVKGNAPGAEGRMWSDVVLAIGEPAAHQLFNVLDGWWRGVGNAVVEAILAGYQVVLPSWGRDFHQRWVLDQRGNFPDKPSPREPRSLDAILAAAENANGKDEAGNA